jgi:hypothetical protein
MRGFGKYTAFLLTALLAAGGMLVPETHAQNARVTYSITRHMGGHELAMTGAQPPRIPFGDYSQYDLDLRFSGEEVLDFGQVRPGDEPVFINFNDPRAVVLEVEGVEFLDVTVSIIPPAGNRLIRDGDSETGIPVNIRLAYSNRGATTPVEAAGQAVEVPGESITFPMRRRIGGPPGPPPTPPHAGYTPPKTKAYLIIYGTLLLGGETLKAGSYLGDIHIDISY